MPWNLLLLASLNACSPEPNDPAISNNIDLSLQADDVSVGQTVEVIVVDADPEASFDWTLDRAPVDSRASLNGSMTATTSFTADRAGEFEVSVTMSTEDLTQSASITVSASLDPDAPTANAGPDRTIVASQIARLDGTGSTDPNALALTYSWRFVDDLEELVLVDDDSPSASFTPDTAGDYTVELVVGNGSSFSEPDDVTVTVLGSVPETPGDVANASLETDQVYVLGKLFNDYGCTRVLFHWSDPDVGAVGFPCGTHQEHAGIDANGDVLYRADGLLWRMQADGPWSPGDGYPAAVMDNDSAVDTPAACDPSSFDNVTDFAVNPQGDVIVQCVGIQWLSSSSGALLFEAWDVFAYADSGHALTADGVADAATGLTTPFSGFLDPTTSDFTIGAARAADHGGFWVATVPGYWYFGSDQPRLWHITTDGQATVEATYPPTASASESGHDDWILDGYGQLFHTTTSSSDTVIVRRSQITGVSTELYDELDGWDVTLDSGSGLLTGP